MMIELVGTFFRGWLITFFVYFLTHEDYNVAILTNMSENYGPWCIFCLN